MIRLCSSYADRPASEWPMLFQRIVSTPPWTGFRQKVRNAVFQNIGDLKPTLPSDDDGDFDLLEALRIDEPGTEGAEDTPVARNSEAIEAESKNCQHVNGKPSCCVTGRN